MIDLRTISSYTARPPLYENGNAEMWTDPYISARLLPIHLDPEQDSASRSVGNIRRTMELLGGFLGRPGMKVLDLGCGPGLYAEALARQGHRVMGIDFSSRSIDHARREAARKGLEIDYRCMNYLDLDEAPEFDLAILIYNDFSPLVPEDRGRLLQRVFAALKPGGVFLFDVNNELDAGERYLDDSSWSLEERGFWRPSAYLELCSYFHYPEDQVYLKQHCIFQEDKDPAIYRFWLHYYSVEQISRLLEQAGFRYLDHYEEVVGATGIWDGEFLNFYAARRP